MKMLLRWAIINFSVCSVFSMQAQTGTLLLYGSVSARYSKKDKQINHFSIYSGIGYQLNDYWTLGVDASYFCAPNEYVGMKGYHIGPFVQYFKALNDNFGFFTEAVIGYRNRDGNGGIFSSFFPAFYVYIGKRWGMYIIPCTLDYSYEKKTQFSLNINKFSILGVSTNIPIIKKK